jgi:hypothetical protein
VALLQQLHPRAEEIYVLVDATLTGREERSYTESLIERFPRPVKVTFAGDLAIPELLEEITRLGPQVPILFLAYSRDREGAVIAADQLAGLVAARAQAPLYVVLEEQLGTGALGGFLMGGRAHGAQAAALALRILAGERAGFLPVVDEPPGQPHFDYRALQRFGVPLSALPAGSVILNRPPGLYETTGMRSGSPRLFLPLLRGDRLPLLNIRRRRIAEEVLEKHRPCSRGSTEWIPSHLLERNGKAFICAAMPCLPRSQVRNPAEGGGEKAISTCHDAPGGPGPPGCRPKVVESGLARSTSSSPSNSRRTRLWIETSRCPVQAQRRGLWRAGVFEDVTVKIRAEEQLYPPRHHRQCPLWDLPDGRAQPLPEGQ